MILLYGAYGYTGRIIAADAQRLGIPLLLAGRDETRLRALGDATGHPIRAFSLDAPDLSGVACVIHAAGPFAVTSKPMVDACLAARVHYLDITGEIEVFEACAARDAEARKTGIALLPGVGFDVVPSDCLAAHVHRRLPTATHLRLAICGAGGISHGTATTMAQNFGKAGAVRRDGRIVPVRPGHAFRTFHFGDVEREAVAIPWGDVSTAWHSTGIPNIEVYSVLPIAAMRAARWAWPFAGVLGWGPVKRSIQARIDAAPAGPSDRARERGWSRIVAEASDADQTVVSRILAPEGYTLTSVAALACAVRHPELKPGFLTPSRAFGADFVLGLPGVTREDV